MNMCRYKKKTPHYANVICKCKCVPCEFTQTLACTHKETYVLVDDVCFLGHVHDNSEGEFVFLDQLNLANLFSKGMEFGVRGGVFMGGSLVGLGVCLCFVRCVRICVRAPLIATLFINTAIVGLLAIFDLRLCCRGCCCRGRCGWRDSLLSLALGYSLDFSDGAADLLESLGGFLSKIIILDIVFILQVSLKSLLKGCVFQGAFLCEQVEEECTQG